MLNQGCSHALTLKLKYLGSGFTCSTKGLGSAKDQRSSGYPVDSSLVGPGIRRVGAAVIRSTKLYTTATNAS